MPHAPAPQLPRSAIVSPLHPAASNPAFRTLRLLSALRKFLVLSALLLTALIFATALRAHSQQLPSPIGAAVPHRYLIAYRGGSVPADTEARIRANLAGAAHIVSGNNPFGISVLDTASDTAGEAATIAALRADPNVEYVIHDRILSAHSLILRPILPASIGVAVAAPLLSPSAPAPYDTYYTSSPQEWAVLQSGGFGAGIPGGPAHGPWDTILSAAKDPCICPCGCLFFGESRGLQPPE